MLAAVVGNHFGAGLDHLSTGWLVAPIRSKYLWMNILHVPAQRISAQQSLVADHTSSDKMTICVRAVDNWACNIIEVRLLTFLECFCYRYKIVQALALITLN